MSNFALNFNMFCDMIDQIIDYNKDFVALNTMAEEICALLNNES